MTTVAGGVTTANTYDGLGQLLTATVDGASTTYTFDGQGRQLTIQDAAGVTTTNTYDVGGRQLSEAVPVQLADGSVVQATTINSWDILGQLLKAVAPSGSKRESVYDRAGRLVSEAIDGNATLTSYDRDGNDVQSTAPDNSVTATDYDHVNRAKTAVVNKVDNPNGPTQSVTTQIYYDAAGRLVATTDAAGFTTRTVYNVRGLLTQTIVNCTDTGTVPTTNPAGCIGGGTHDNSTNVVSLTTYDGYGQVVSVTSAQGTGAEATTNFAYDAAGRRQAVQDPRGTVTRFFYDGSSRETSTIVNCTTATSNPSPPTINWWTCAGSALNDGTWNVTTSHTYDAKGNIDTETAANGRVTKAIYDISGRLIQRIENYVPGTPTADQNISTYYAYDSAGHGAAVRAPTADRTTFTVTRDIYDANGRLAQEIRGCTNSGKTAPPDPDWKTCAATGTIDFETNLTTTFGYDLRGNRVAVTSADPSATTGTSAASITTRYVYDSLDRLCRVVENASVDPYTLNDPCSTAISGTATTNVSTRYTFDGAGNMVAMYDGRGDVTRYGYDALGNMTTYADPADPNGPAGNATTYTFDGLGRRVSQSVRGTSTALITWAYDAAGHVLTRTADSANTTYTYDVKGNRLTATNSVGTITTTYDRLNRPLTVSDSADNGNSSSYTYSLTAPSWTDPSGGYSATLDAYGRELTLLEPVHSSSFAWTYRADSQPATAATPSTVGLATTYGYDLVADLSSKSTEKSQGHQSRAAYSWTRNRAGQILSESSTISNDPTNGTTTYTYDQLGQLASYQLGANPTTTHGWQQVPNRASVQVGTNPAVTTTFDVANRPTSSSDGSSYAYDVEGRLTARPGQTLHWDSLGRLTEVDNSGNGSVIAAYTYDALDRLRTAGTQSVRTRFRYVGVTTAVAQTLDDIGGSVIRSIANDSNGERLLDWTGTNANQRIYGTNLHHDVTWTGSSSAAVSATLRYDPWGTMVGSFGTSLPDFRFQGSWYDTGSQLSWAVTRWYAPALGRFVSEDSRLGDTAHPADRNLYAYGSGDPVSRLDPDGRYWYRVRDWTTIRDLSSSKGVTWKMFWQANRYQVPSSPTYQLFPSQCVYIPLEWRNPKPSTIPSNNCVSAYPGPHNFDAVFGSTNWRIPLAAAQRAEGLSSSYLMDFTRTWLIDLTLRVTKRPPNAPTEWQIFDLIPNTLPLNYVSWAVTTANGWHSQQSTVAKDMHLVTGGAPAWCQSYPCTFGQFVFLNGRSPTTTLLGHEYIHILEGEGLGIDFVRQYLSSEIGNQIFNAGLNALANVANWPPSLRASWNNLQLPSAANVMEAPAWLWEAFGGSSWYVPSDLPWRLWSPAPFVGITM